MSGRPREQDSAQSHVAGGSDVAPGGGAVGGADPEPAAAPGWVGGITTTPITTIAITGSMELKGFTARRPELAERYLPAPIPLALADHVPAPAGRPGPAPVP